MILMKSFFFTQCLFLMVMALGMVAQRFGILPFRIAFSAFAIALLLAALVALLSLVFFLLTFFSLPSDMRFSAFAAFAIGVLPILAIVILVGPGLKVPQIHDISTDLENSLEFTHAKSLRQPDENSLEPPSDAVVALQAGYYKELDPLVVPEAPAEAYERAVAVAKSLGWSIEHEDQQNLRFEATDTSKLFGFVDDVVVRITAIEQGSVIDTRSVSRVGKSDLGANAKRIERFQKAYLAMMVDAKS